MLKLNFLSWLLFSSLLFAQTNTPPTVRITYPEVGSYFGTVALKVKAEASDLEGRVSEVRFFADERLIGVATNAPFNIAWRVERHDDPIKTSEWLLTAVAKDELGATSRSLPVNIFYYLGAPPAPAVPIISPKNGELFPVGQELGFTAEVTASASVDSGPVEFIVDGNSVGQMNQTNGFNATNPPMSVVVRDLPEGFHAFTVRFLGSNGGVCDCNTITNVIEVVKLGIANPVAVDGRMRFEIVSAFTNRPISIERLTVGSQWQVRTNFPAGASRTTFSEALEPNQVTVWYRASVSSP